VLVQKGQNDPLSDPVEGDTSTKVLKMLPSYLLQEDSTLQVKAYRTDGSGKPAYLATTVSVLVRPNPKVAVRVDPSTPPVVDYGAGAPLPLSGAQESADYRLYRRELVAADYFEEPGAGRLEVTTGAGHSVFIQAPPKIPDWDHQTDFTLVGAFKHQT